VVTLFQRRETVMAGLFLLGGAAGATLFISYGGLALVVALFGCVQIFLVGFWKQSSP
jgi:hypothetical protein